MGFSIGKSSSIFMNCKFDCAKGLVIGHNSVINADCRLDARGGLTIGNNVSISEQVVILTADHNEDWLNIKDRSKKVFIDDYVWIGTRAMILPGVTIGKGAVVAAGAVVTRDIPPFCVYGGVPAKFIKKRIEKLDYTASYRRLFQ
jgi:acetyltransferase-like isoleucine patch superfamily enzyme